MNTNQLVGIVERGVKAHRRGMLFLAGFIVVLGVVGIVFLQPDTLDTSTRVARRALLGCYVLPPAGLALGLYVWLRKSQALEVLRGAPGSVVWAYVDNRGQQGTWLVLALQDGKKIDAPLDLLDMEPLQRDLGTMLPAATVGFSPALEARFRADPSSLRRSPQG